MNNSILLKGFYLVDDEEEFKKNDVEIKNNIITKVGKIKKKNNYDSIIKGENKYVLPGFIDMHSHADLINFTEEGLVDKIKQGVTTEVTGQCGVGPAPLKDDIKSKWQKHIIIRNPFTKIPWSSVKEYFDYLEQKGLDNNFIYFLPSGLLRYYVKQGEKGEMNNIELEEFKKVIINSFKEGCLGVSLGLCYFPAINSTYKELKTIFKLAGEYNKLISVHLKSEGSNILNSLNNIISLSQGTNCKINISHLKIIGEANQYKLNKLLSKIEENEFTFDSYPYNFGSTTLEIIIPPDYFNNSLESLNNKKLRSELKEIYKKDNRKYENWDNLPYLIGWDNIYITDLESNENKDLIGLSIQEISGKWDMDPTDVAIDLLIKENGNVLMQDYYMKEKIIKQILTNKNGSIGTDSLFSKSNQHPRTSNTYPKILKKYVFEKGLISLKTAIDKFSKKPAEVLGLKDRGKIAPGYKADLVIFSKEDLLQEDNNGINSVMINGEWKLKNGIYNKNSKPGTIIK